MPDMPRPRLAFLPHECRNVDLGHLWPMVHEHALPADKRRPAVGGADQHAVAHRLDLQFTSRGEMKLIAKRFRHDQAAGHINGSFHAKMVTQMGAAGKAEVVAYFPLYAERRANARTVAITWSMWASLRPGYTPSQNV